MKPLVTDTIAQLRPYEAGKPPEEIARDYGVPDAVKLASNENPLGPSPRALEAARRALSQVHRYPDANAFTLRQALSERLGVKPEQLIFGNGSNELIELIVRTFCTGAHHLVFAEPSFVVYRIAAMAQGVPFTAVPLNQQVHDLEAMGQAVFERTRIVFIANPNNPTGTYVDQSALGRFLSQLPEDVIAVIDEAYLEYAVAADYPDALRCLSSHPRAIVLRTFSKAYGLAGLRLGYAVAPAELALHLNAVRAPFNANSLAQAAALAALGDSEHLRQVRELNRSEMERIERALRANPEVKVVPSQANFLLLELDRPGAEVYQRLLRRGVIVRPIPPLPNAVRVSIGLPAENDRFLAALREVLREPR